MAENLDALISKIKNQGLLQAEEEKTQILTNAQNRAASIIAAAEKKSDDLIKQTTKLNEEKMAAGVIALQHAARDIVLELKNKIIALQKLVCREQIERSLDHSMVEKLLKAFLAEWNSDEYPTVDIYLNENEYTEFKTVINRVLGEKFRDHVAVKYSNKIQQGFQITERDKNVSYDFTPEGIAEVMALRLTPELKEVLNTISANGWNIE